MKFQCATFGIKEISVLQTIVIHTILIRSLTGSEPKMTIADHISDFSGVWRIRLSFQFHNSVNQF